MVETSIIEQIEAKCAGDNIPRHYLGLSEIGHHCPRWLWYAHHGAAATLTEGRTIRLFRLGNMVEDGIISDLRGIGWDITDQQKEVEITQDGITLNGHIDGIANGTHVLEIKSANDKSFNVCMKVGYEKWNQKYKAQLHTYMVLCGLKKSIAIVENKNDSRLYIEEINLDSDYVTKLLIDVFSAITAIEPPDRTCPDASWYQSKFCNRSSLCFK